MYKVRIARYLLIFLSITVLLFSFSAVTAYSQNFLDISKGFDEFKWGIKSFYSGFFNRSVFSFEKALSYNPSDNLSREWLGRAYYMSGLEDTALTVWKSLIDSGYKSVNLNNKMEIISGRRKIYDILPRNEKLIIESEISGSEPAGTVLFRRPGGILPLSTGDFILASYATNELVYFNANGRILRRIKGGLGILNRPFDLLKIDDDTLIVSEYGGNQLSRIKLNGTIEKKFGKTGRGDGELMGPQYLADNGRGYIYVSDWGNRRVSKFDYDGEFILSFGSSAGRYGGLKGPTGVAVLNDMVYVADSNRKCIDVFDQSGNFIKTTGTGMFNSPEGLSVFDDNNLIVADTNRIILFNVSLQYAETIFDSRIPGGRIAFAKFTANNDLLAADFDNNRLYFLSDIESVYEGLFVRIDRIFEENFPAVRVVASIQRRNGLPVVGLEKNNFRISENALYPDDLNMIFAGNNSQTADVSVIFEESMFMTEKKDILKRSIDEIYSSFSSTDRLRLIAAGREASIIADENTSREDIARSMMRIDSNSRSFSPGAGIRLGGTELVSSVNKKAVIMVYSGSPAVFDFDRYRLIDIMQFLRNNNIMFYYIYLEQGGTNEELDYLCRETGGRSIYIYQSDGIKGLGKEIKSSSNGYYVLEYVSKSFDEYGRKYIPVRLEAVYNKKSGRDELGYFTSSN